MAWSAALIEEPRRWSTVLVGGLVIGTAAAVGYRLGVWESGAAALAAAGIEMTRAVNLVYVVMLAIGARVGVLVHCAYASRSDHLAPVQPVRPELSQLAPIFTGVGFAGTVAGYIAGFGSLEDQRASELLTALPELLAGVSASMTSTLVGLSLWGATLLLAAWMPVWSWAHIVWDEDDVRIDFDGRSLGRGTAAVEILAEAVGSRQPEALCLAFDRDIPSNLRERVITAVWSQRAVDLPLRVETLSAGKRR